MVPAPMGSNEKDGPTPPAHEIAVLVGHEANRRLLTDWLDGETDISVHPGTDPSVLDDDIDLCVIDEAVLGRDAQRLGDWKDAASVYRPCLFVSERGELALSDTHRSFVSEVIDLPVGRADLSRRIRRHLGERKQSRRLATEREQLDEQNERLRTFAARLAHDLRNPLGIAKGYTGQARESGAEKDFDAVEQALERMQRLIDETLTLAKLGETVADQEPVQLRQIAERAWQNVATQQATLMIESDGEFDADAGRLLDLFENLFRNAVEHGGKTVTVTVETIGTDGFAVADDGAGIPEADRDMVFEVGYTTNVDGTGFGLRIVREIAEAHGWEVAVTESSDGGARFEFTGIEFRTVD